MENLAKILFQWGPAGVAAILMVIGEKRLRTRWDLSKGQERKICARLYIGNWVFIAIMLTVVASIWVIDRNKTGITMSGIVQDLSGDYSINEPTGKLYSKTSYKSVIYRDVEWHSSDPIVKNLDLRLEKGDDYHDFRIPLDEVEDVLNIHVKLVDGKLWLKTSDLINKELEVVGSASSELRPMTLFDNPYELFLISNAYAKEQVDTGIVIDALSSRNSYVRQSASLYLVDNINVSSSLIEEKILSEKTSVTTQIGLVSALARASSNELSNQRTWAISESAEKKIIDFTFSDNKVLAAQSRRYLTRNTTDQNLVWMNERCAQFSDENISEKQYCSWVSMNMIYNLGIKKWMQSMGKPIDQSIAELDDALRLLDRGDILFEQASEEDEIQYGKLLYGKALLNHEMSKLQSENGSTEGIKASQRNSVSNFNKLIAYLDEEHMGEYDYPHHLEQANCYIKTQIQKCFDDFAP